MEVWINELLTVVNQAILMLQNQSNLIRESANLRNGLIGSFDTFCGGEKCTS